MKISRKGQLFMTAFAVAAIALVGTVVYRVDAIAAEMSVNVEWKASELSAYLHWIEEGAPGIDPETKVSLDRNEVPEKFLKLAKAFDEASKEKLRKLVDDIKKIEITGGELSKEELRSSDEQVKVFLDTLERKLDEFEKQQKKKK